MIQRITTAIADEVERLRGAELDAKQQYYDAVEQSDLAATREAAANWIRAGDALAACVAKHSYRRGEFGVSS